MNWLQKTSWQKVGLVAAATVIGTIADTLLSSRMPLLKEHTHVSWHPSFDLAVIQFSLTLSLSANWGSLVGFAGGLLVARRSK